VRSGGRPGLGTGGHLAVEHEAALPEVLPRLAAADQRDDRDHSAEDADNPQDRAECSVHRISLAHSMALLNTPWPDPDKGPGWKPTSGELAPRDRLSCLHSN